MDLILILTIVGSNIVLALMSLGTTITLFLWARSEARADQQEIREEFRHFSNMMAQEVKDFHGKLERQDAEFKAFLMNKNKI